MSLIDALGGVAAQGMALLTEAHNVDKHDLARRAGITRSKAGQWVKVAARYLGPTRAKKKQQQAIQAAMRNRHSIDTLVLIDQRAGKNWALRLRLCQFAGSHDEVAAEARRLTADRVRRVRTHGVRFARDRSAVVLVTDPATIADIEAQIRRGLDRDQPVGPQLAQNFVRLLRDGGVPRSQPRPTIQITLDQHVAVMAGQGDDIELAVSDGTTMTGAQYAARAFKECGIVLVDPVAGPVNLYRGQRLASAKQRAMLVALQPRCCWDGCNHPAEYADVHHIVEWASGGMTNIRNLMLLCPYHNAVNGLPGRGRMVYIGTTPTRIPS